MATTIVGLCAASAAGVGVWMRPSPPLSLAFDGVNDHVELAQMPALGGSGFTLEAWVKTRAGGDKKANILARRHPHQARRDAFIFRLRKDMGDTLELGLGDGAREWGMHSRAPVPQDWTHVAATFDGSSGRVCLYIAGALDSCDHAKLRPLDDALPLWLGADPFVGASGRAWSGHIAEIAVWSRALEAAEIVRSSEGLSGDEAGLALYWTAQRSAGQLLFDTSEGHHHGTLGASPDADDADPEWSAEGPPRP